MVRVAIEVCDSHSLTAIDAVHITEYENYGGYDRSSKLIRDSEVRAKSLTSSVLSSDIHSSTASVTRKCYRSCNQERPR